LRFVSFMARSIGLSFESLGWGARHPRTLLIAAITLAAAWPVWRKIRRAKNIRIEPLSQRWLAEHEWESGRHVDDI